MDLRRARTTGAPPAADFADVLTRVHAGMRALDVAVPWYTERVASAERLVSSRDSTPELTDPDRELLLETLRDRSRLVADRAAPEQLLHGEPHPGNLLRAPGTGCARVLAMATAWRWDRDDELPDGRRLGAQWLDQLRVSVRGWRRPRRSWGR